jgi:hypothetical protein
MENNPADLNKLLKNVEKPTYALCSTNMPPRQMVSIPCPHISSYIPVEWSVG